MRILIVDDNFMTRKLLSRLLEPYGICDFAESGEVALDAYQLALYDQDPYQLVCLDIRLPGLQGTDVLKQIRSMDTKHGIPLGVNSCKIIMITGVDDKEAIFENFRANCDGYLIKPVCKDPLLNILKDLQLIDEVFKNN